MSRARAFFCAMLDDAERDIRDTTTEVAEASRFAAATGNGPPLESRLTFKITFVIR